MAGTRVDNVGVRVVAAVGLVVATVIHVLLGGFDGTLPILFLLSALGTALGAVLLFVRPRLGWIVGGGVCALTATGYVMSSTVGLPPDFSGGAGFFSSTPGAISATAEIVVALLAVYVLTDRSTRSANRVR